MKLIIDIPEEDYTRLRDEGMFGNVTTFKRAVREGIPLEQAPCEMTAEEYRQRMIQAFHNADCDELIALVVLPTEKEFEHLEWLLEKHYKAKPEPCEDEYIKVPKKALKYRTAGMVAYNAEWLKNHFNIERAVICGVQEPCDDCISRQAVLEKAICVPIARVVTEDKVIYRKIVFVDEIENIPPVTPAEKVGQWENHKCSACGYGVMPWNDTPYCPNCGAKMLASPTGAEEENE